MEDPLDLKLLMSHTQTSNADVLTDSSTSGTHKLLYKCDQCNTSFSDKNYFELHKQSHEQKDIPLVHFVVNSSSAPQVVSQPTQPHHAQVILPEDQLAAYKRGYGLESQQVFTLSPGTQYQVISSNGQAGAISIPQSIQNFPNATYVVASADDHQFQTLPGTIVHTQVENQELQKQDISLQQRSVNEMHLSMVTDQGPIPVIQQPHQTQQNMHVSNPVRTSRTVVVNTKDRPFKCNQCTASFIELDELEEHKKKHTKDGPFTCEDCHFTFMYKSHFKSHKTRCLKRRAMMSKTSTTGPTVLTPITTKREFPTNNISQEDIKPINFVQYPVQNNASIVVQSQPPSYIQHSSQQAFNNVNVPTAIPNHVTQVRQINRQLPPSKFNPSNPSFKRIKKESRIDRPYECNECDASFQSEVELRSHKIKHTGDGPFTCEECKFVFLYRKLFEAHKRRCEKKRKDATFTVSTAAPAVTLTSIHNVVSNNNAIVETQVSQVQHVQPLQIQQQDIHIPIAQTVTSGVPASIATSTVPGTLQLATVSGQPTIIEMRPNGESQELNHTRIPPNSVIEQVLVAPGTPISSIIGGRQDVKYEIVPIPAGLLDLTDGVVNMDQIMNFIKLKGSNQ